MTYQLEPQNCFSFHILTSKKLDADSALNITAASNEVVTAGWIVFQLCSKNDHVVRVKFNYYGKVNPSVLIGSFLVRISPYGPLPWKRSSAVYFFVFESRQIQNKHGPSAK